MKKLRPTGYVSAEESMKPGYLAAKFAKLRREQEQNEAERKAKVEQLPKRKAHG